MFRIVERKQRSPAIEANNGLESRRMNEIDLGRSWPENRIERRSIVPFPP